MKSYREVTLNAGTIRRALMVQVEQKHVQCCRPIRFIRESGPQSLTAQREEWETASEINTGPNSLYSSIEYHFVASELVGLIDGMS